METITMFNPNSIWVTITLLIMLILLAILGGPNV